jgi:hypothetical protein
MRANSTTIALIDEAIEELKSRGLEEKITLKEVAELFVEHLLGALVDALRQGLRQRQELL